MKYILEVSAHQNITCKSRYTSTDTFNNRDEALDEAYSKMERLSRDRDNDPRQAVLDKDGRVDMGDYDIAIYELPTIESYQIETCDGLHNSGAAYVSLKTITTELPNECIDVPSGVSVADHIAWCKDYLAAASAYDVAVAEAKGRANAEQNEDAINEALEEQAERIGDTAPDYDTLIGRYSDFTATLEAL